MSYYFCLYPSAKYGTFAVALFSVNRSLLSPSLSSSRPLSPLRFLLCHVTIPPPSLTLPHHFLLSLPITLSPHHDFISSLRFSVPFFHSYLFSSPIYLSFSPFPFCLLFPYHLCSPFPCLSLLPKKVLLCA